MLASLRTYFARLHWLLFPLLTIPGLWYLLTAGLPSRFDRGLHLMRLAWLDQHLRQGTLFPRWIPEMMLGRGYPLFDFYGAGVYYLSELFFLLGLNLSDATVATLIVLVLLAGYGIFLLTRDLFGREALWACWLAAIAYVYAPYFLTVNIYQRGAIAEATAQALMPWVLWSARRLFTSQAPSYWATVLALLLATLVFSHTLMLLIFPPLLAGYLLILWLQNGRRRRSVGWALFALLMAIGISAFFWIPLIVERQYLSKFAYGIVRGAFLPRSTWTWETFFAKEWLYTYVRPPRLGLVQLLLGVIGALVTIAWRRTLENGYLILCALVAGAAVGSWARPLWESSEVLLSIQSPWRLLTLITLVLAILTGAMVAYLPLKRLQPWLAVALMGVIIYTCLPRLPGVPFFARTDAEFPRNMLAQQEYEQGVETGGEGSTFVQEFRPLWADRSLIFTTPAGLSAPALELQPYEGNAYSVALNVTSAAGGPLRLSQFYFPGWQARLADGSELTTYPSTNLGLLTVDLPAGSQQLTLAWTGTTTQRLAGIISMVTLALLAGINVWQRRRVLALIPLLLLVVALTANFVHPAQETIHAPTEAVEGQGVRLLGYRTEQSDPTRIYLYPYWYVLAGGPNANFKARWQLQDASGVIRAEIVSGPYFNASSPRTWPPGTLIEDAYTLPLPPGLAAGSYQLLLQVEGDGATGPTTPVGTVALATATPPQEIEQYESERVATNALFDDEIYLKGYAPPASSQPLNSVDDPPIFKAGATITYRLYWQAAKTPSENYHSYIHLLDSAGNAIFHSDQLPGPWFRPPKGWDTYYLQQDTHDLEIPADAPGGLYWPAVGMYEIRQMNRMAVTVDGQPVPGDVLRLAPVKVVGAPAKPPIAHIAHFADGFDLIGYAVKAPEGGFTPGAPFTVDLYYRSNAKTGKDYTRFFHLYNPDLGLAAQADSPPQAGINPTWSWVPGETIVDTVALQVAADAKPGEYRLFMGFYDAQAGGVRLGVQDETGQPLPDDGVVLQTVQVQAK